MIFYFSGTGNSEYAARKIAAYIKDDICCLNEKIKKGQSFAAENAGSRALVFVAPVYGWRLPRLVENWILEAQFPQHIPAYFVLTCGSEMGDSAKYVKKLCKEKSFNYMGCAEVVMPENYIALFEAPEEAEAREIVKAAGPKIDMLAEKIRENSRFDHEPVGIMDKIKSDIVNPLFYMTTVKAKKFAADEKCISCGKCAKECPMNNISIKEGIPVWSDNCTHCMACITGCPAEAIEYGRKSIGKPRYRCPDMENHDL